MATKRTAFVTARDEDGVSRMPGADDESMGGVSFDPLFEPMERTATRGW